MKKNAPKKPLTKYQRQMRIFTYTLLGIGILGTILLIIGLYMGGMDLWEWATSPQGCFIWVLCALFILGVIGFIIYQEGLKNK